MWGPDPISLRRFSALCCLPSTSVTSRALRRTEQAATPTADHDVEVEIMELATFAAMTGGS